MMCAMNSLHQYLKSEKTTQAALANQLGISISMVSRIVSGERKPSVGLTKRIEALTGIHRHFLRPDIYEAAQ